MCVITFVDVTTDYPLLSPLTTHYRKHSKHRWSVLALIESSCSR